MSEQSATPVRPRQVTMAVVMSVVGSVLLVVSLFETLGRLRTADMRASIDSFLTTPPGDGLGLETAQVVEGMRILVLVSGALAAAAVVFAVFVGLRHRGARIGLTVTAGLLVLTLPVAGLMPVLLAVSAGLLWSRPARDWYDGRTPVSDSSPAAQARLHSEQGPPSAPEPPPYGQQQPAPSGHPAPYGQPAPAPPYAQPYPQSPPQSYPQSYPPQYAQQYAQPAQGGPGQGPSGRGKRPTTVTLAAVFTWIGSGAVLVASLVFAAVLAGGGTAFVNEVDSAAAGSQLDLTTDQILAVGWGIVGFFAVWSLIAALLAVFVFRGSNPARYTLAVSAVVATLVSLLMILSLVSVVTLLLAGATVVLLFTGGANDWFAGRSGGTPPYPPPGQYGYDSSPQAGPPPEPPTRNQPW